MINDQQFEAMLAALADINQSINSLARTVAESSLAVHDAILDAAASVDNYTTAPSEADSLDD